VRARQRRGQPGGPERLLGLEADLYGRRHVADSPSYQLQAASVTLDLPLAPSEPST
jgi:hypothetical protein